MLKIKRREFIVDEKDVTTVIWIANIHQIHNGFSVGRCGWADKPNKWFIFFDADNNTFERIVRYLEDLGTVEHDKRSYYFTKTEL